MDMLKTLTKSVPENMPKVRLRPKSDRTTLQARPTSPYSQVYRNRSSSAPKHPPEEENESLDEVEEIEENNEHHHRVGCPRFKLKPKTRNNSPSRFSANHPRPWGARDPDDIPCYCRMIRMREESSKGKQLKGKNNISDLFAKRKIPTARANSHQDPHKEITDLFDEFCSEVVKRRVKLTKTELTEMSKKLVERFSKPKEKVTVSPKKPPVQDSLPKNSVKRQKENNNVNNVNDKLNRSERNLPNTEVSHTGKSDANIRQLFDNMKNSDEGTYQVLAVKCGYYSEGLITGAGIPQLEMDEQNKMEYNAKYQDASRGIGDREYNQMTKTNALFNSNVPKLATIRKHKRR